MLSADSNAIHVSTCGPARSLLSTRVVLVQVAKNVCVVFVICEYTNEHNQLTLGACVICDIYRHVCCVSPRLRCARERERCADVAACVSVLYEIVTPDAMLPRELRVKRDPDTRDRAHKPHNNCSCSPAGFSTSCIVSFTA